MHRRDRGAGRWPICVLSLLLLVTGTTASAAEAGGEAAALERARGEMKVIRHRIAQARAQAADIRKELDRLTRRIEGLDGYIRAGERRLGATESDIRSTLRQIVELERQATAIRDIANRRARALYKAGPVQALAPLVSARSFAELTRATTVVSRTSELDGQRLIRAARVRADLAERTEDLARLRSALKAETAALQERRSAVQSVRAFRDEALSDVEGRIATEERQLKELERQSKELTARLRSTLPRSTGPISASGFVWPVRGAVTSPFGPRWGSFHPGLDIDGETGDPIRAARDGVVTGISCGNGYGICSIIDHGNGLTTLYAHMVRKAMTSGSVRKGDVIGYVGSTGFSTGSHLHFEVRVDGEPRNPRGFLS
jgi:murein DD-endopeptidase MepM/ murein hydrolase activator NlpD